MWGCEVETRGYSPIRQHESSARRFGARVCARVSTSKLDEHARNPRVDAEHRFGPVVRVWLLPHAGPRVSLAYQCGRGALRLDWTARHLESARSSRTGTRTFQAAARPL